MPRIVTISSDRADVGIQTMVWRALAARPEVELNVLLTGTYCREGSTPVTLPETAAAYRAGADLGGAGSAEAARAMGRIHDDAAEIYEQLQPDIVLATGDRLDMLPAVTATLAYNLPVAHLHGGELTLGAIDDRVRHAVTKLSHLHFTATAEAAARVAAMGEEPWRIHLTGAPGLDTLLEQPVLDAAEFAAEVGFDDIQGLRLVTVHPETNAAEPAAAAQAVLAALDGAAAPTLLTAPNADPGGGVIRRSIEEFARARPWAEFRDTLGARLYANALRHAAVMVGNSSSGVIEAGLFGLPAINVGGRQAGRPRGPNVIDVTAERDAVVDALSRLPAKNGDARFSLYGDGHAAPRIATVLSDLPARERLLAKRFSAERPDFTAPWSI